MPIYTFYNKRSKKEWDDMMTMSEMEEYLAKNKHITQVLTTHKYSKWCTRHGNIQVRQWLGKII